MNFTDILRRFGALGYVEVADIKKFTNAPQKTVLQGVYRWRQKGLLIPIRRGFYAFPDDLAKNPLTVERTANLIRRETYITGLWRLNQLGLIPEGVVMVTNATTGNPVEFDTPMGRFAYQHIQPKGFFGFVETPDATGHTVRMATPEKALLDFFWLKAVEWNQIEFERWRIQDPFRRLNIAFLKELALRWDQPRLIRAANAFEAYLNAA